VSLRSVSPVRDSLYERVSGGRLADWQLQASSFEAIAGYRWYTVDVLGGTESERLNGLFATPEFFNVFGVPLMGRGFLPADRGTRTIVLGHDAWRGRFDADATLVGNTVALNARNFSRVGPTPHVVVGIADAPVRFPPTTADFQLGLGSPQGGVMAGSCAVSPSRLVCQCERATAKAQSFEGTALRPISSRNTWLRHQTASGFWLLSKTSRNCETERRRTTTP
jgi:hypothetical protein